MLVPETSFGPMDPVYYFGFLYGPSSSRNKLSAIRYVAHEEGLCCISQSDQQKPLAHFRTALAAGAEPCATAFS